MEPIPPRLIESKVTPTLTRSRGMYDDRWRGRVGREKPSYTPIDDGSPVIDYSEAQEAPRFVKGERVRHPQFGRGIIRELSGFGRDLKAVIDFEGVGRKKVVLRYANLQKEL